MNKPLVEAKTMRAYNPSQPLRHQHALLRAQTQPLSHPNALIEWMIEKRIEWAIDGVREVSTPTFSAAALNRSITNLNASCESSP